MFSYILQVIVCNVWCCTVSNFYHARDIFIIYCSGGGFLFVYLSCRMATYAYNEINIYRVWTNNGNTRQYRNKIVSVGCTDRTLFFCLFVLYSASVIALQVVFSDSLYESTAKWETSQIFKEVRLLMHI